MFERMAIGWRIAVGSWRTLMADKELICFPILSGLACLAMLTMVAVPIIASPELQQRLSQTDWDNNPLMILAGLAFYIVNSFIVVYFNSALVACALIRFSGGDPTISDGIRAANARMPQIFLWAVVAGTVGWILRMVEERVEFVGRLIIGLLGAGWAIATFFVIPVLVVERKGPVDAVKRSAGIMAKTWGESLVAHASIGLVVFLMMLPGIAGLLTGTLLFANESFWLGMTCVGLAVAWFMAAGAIGAALQGIYVAALYSYAAQGRIPNVYEPGLLQSAFGPKNANG